MKALEAVDEVAAQHDTNAASVTLAWASADNKITVPIAPATTLTQLDELFAAAALQLTDVQVAKLDEASAPFA